MASLGGTVEAMQFSQPVKIGSYYNARAGGPSLARGEGYTKMTNNQCTFGKGEMHLFLHIRIYIAHQEMVGFKVHLCVLVFM